MKKILVLFLLCSQIIWSQKVEFGTNIVVDVPVRSTMTDTRTVGNFQLFLNYNPFVALPLHFEYQIMWGQSGSRTLTQFFFVDDFSGVDASVRYTNFFNRQMLGAKLYMNYSYSDVRPFFKPQVGWGKAKTKMRAQHRYIDANGETETDLLRNRSTFKSSGFLYGAELGVEAQLSKLFPKKFKSRGGHMSLTFHVLRSFKDFEYTNVKQLDDRPGYEEEYLYGDEDFPIAEYPYEFVTISTDDIYEQKISELHRTQLFYWGFQIGFFVSIKG